jgi:hypothetical protein
MQDVSNQMVSQLQDALALAYTLRLAKRAIAQSDSRLHCRALFNLAAFPNNELDSGTDCHLYSRILSNASLVELFQLLFLLGVDISAARQCI